LRKIDNPGDLGMALNAASHIAMKRSPPWLRAVRSAPHGSNHRPGLFRFHG
jgi:hypothetical protein